MNSIYLEITLHYITLTDYYIVKGHIQITSNHINVNVKQKKYNRVNKIEFNTLRNYTTLYHTYYILYCKGHIQKTSICNVIVEKEKTIE